MSLQKAIEILENRLESQLSCFKNGLCNSDYINGVTDSIELLRTYKGLYEVCWKFKPSEDTAYKKDLTAWIERQRYKRHWGRDKHISTWASTSATICPHITEEGQG